MSQQSEHIKANGEQCRRLAIWGSDPPRCATHRLDGGPRTYRVEPGNQGVRLKLTHGFRTLAPGPALSLQDKEARCQLIHARLQRLLDRADSEHQVLRYSRLSRHNLGRLMGLIEEYEQTTGQHPDQLLQKAAGEPLAALQAELQARLQAVRASVKSRYPTTRRRSPRYWLVYQAIVDHIREHQVGPTWRYLRKVCSIPSNRSLAYWPDRLEADGLIIRRHCRHGLDLPGDPEDPDRVRTALEGGKG
jgi:hypothetical protein